MAETKEKGRNSISSEALRGYVHRIEQVEERKQQCTDDIRAIYAEAKSNGFTPKYIREVVKERRKPPSERDDHRAMRDMYEAASGLSDDLPLFRHVDAIDVDLTARASVVEALKKLVPTNGEIIVNVGGKSVRLWRDTDGEAHAEEVVEPPADPAPEFGGPPPEPKPEVPDVSEDEAEELGRAAAKNDEPIIANPFPWNDDRRARWDLGWRKEAGNDGMGPDS